MSTVTKTFSAAGQTSDVFTLFAAPPTAPGPNTAAYTITGTFVGTIVLEGSADRSAWSTLATYTTTVSSTTIVGPILSNPPVYYRFRCSAYTSGSSVATIADNDNVVFQLENTGGDVVFQVLDSGPVSGDSQVGELVVNSLVGDGEEYAGAGSFQVVAPDLNLNADAGSADGSDPKFLGAVMGNIMGDELTKDANYLGGVIGAYSVTGTKATTYPAGGVLGQISDGVTDADGAVVAYVDGDSSITKANAAFKAMANNSNPGSGFDYGLDLTSPAHDGFSALAILKADLRLSNDVCTLQGAGVPTDGTSGTGAGFAGPGSLYIRVAGASSNAYINCNTKASPTWKLVTRAA